MCLCAFPQCWYVFKRREEKRRELYIFWNVTPLTNPEDFQLNDECGFSAHIIKCSVSVLEQLRLECCCRPSEPLRLPRTTMLGIDVARFLTWIILLTVLLLKPIIFFSFIIIMSITSTTGKCKVQSVWILTAQLVICNKNSIDKKKSCWYFIKLLKVIY